MRRKDLCSSDGVPQPGGSIMRDARTRLRPSYATRTYSLRSRVMCTRDRTGHAAREAPAQAPATVVVIQWKPGIMIMEKRDL